MYVYVYMYIQQNVTVIVIGLSFPTLAGSPFRFALILGLVNHVKKMVVKTNLRQGAGQGDSIPATWFRGFESLSLNSKS